MLGSNCIIFVQVYFTKIAKLYGGNELRRRSKANIGVTVRIWFSKMKLEVACLLFVSAVLSQVFYIII